MERSKDWTLVFELGPLPGVTVPVAGPPVWLQSLHFFHSGELLPPLLLTSLKDHSLYLWRKKAPGKYFTLMCLEHFVQPRKIGRSLSNCVQRKLHISLATVCKLLLLHPAIFCPVLTVLPWEGNRRSCRKNEIPVPPPPAPPTPGRCMGLRGGIFNGDLSITLKVWAFGEEVGKEIFKNGFCIPCLPHLCASKIGCLSD